MIEQKEWKDFSVVKLCEGLSIAMADERGTDAQSKLYLQTLRLAEEVCAVALVSAWLDSGRPCLFLSRLRQLDERVGAKWKELMACAMSSFAFLQGDAMATHPFALEVE